MEHSYNKNPLKNQWKKCKLLESHIDTESDVKYRRGLKITHENA